MLARITLLSQWAPRQEIQAKTCRHFLSKTYKNLERDSLSQSVKRRKPLVLRRTVIPDLRTKAAIRLINLREGAKIRNKYLGPKHKRETHLKKETGK